MASDEVPGGWVRLNVGGRTFVTMKQTLRVSPFFARLLETDDRMPDATAGSPTHFIDRSPDRVTKVLDYLRDGTLFADKNCNLKELRLEADFYGLDGLVRIIDETKTHNELRNTTKCVVVCLKGGSFEIAVNPRDDDHFLLRQLQQRYPCRVRAPSFQFPYGFTFKLRACGDCQRCATGSYDYHCERYLYDDDGYEPPHGCACAPGTADDMLNDVVETLESRGYVMDRNVDAIFTRSGKEATSWTFVKREG